MTKTTESKWRAWIEEQESSGLTVREFAARHDLSPATVYWWRTRLRRRSAEVLDLVPVEVVEKVTERRSAIEIVLRDDIVLRLPRGFDDGDLGRVLAALARSC
jgi:hypothetical protein